MTAPAPEKPQNTSRFWRTLCIRLAVAAGVFSLLVGASLYYMWNQRVTEDVLEDPQLVQIRQQLAADEESEQLKQAFRRRDLQVRQAYFHRKEMLQRGGWLLGAGLAVLVLSVAVAVGIEGDTPLPKAAPPDPSGTSKADAWGRWGVMGLVILGGAGAAAAMFMVPAWTGPGFVPAGGNGDGPAVPAPSPPSLADLAENWYRFRGPGGDGVRNDPNLTLRFDIESGENVLWTAELPTADGETLPGSSSPIVWGERLYVSAGNDEAHVIACYDAATGESLWQTDVTTPQGRTVKLENLWEPSVHAASTPVTDGRYVAAWFANGDLACVDAETGQIEWKQHLGKPDNMYGHASSLALYGEHLILQYDQGMGGGGLSKLIARKIDSGAIAWSVDRPVGSSWATPIIIRPESGDQIVTSSDPLVTGHSAADGTELWRVDAMGADHTPSPIYVAGLVIAASGSADMVAVDPADRGEVEPKWVADEGIPDIPTPVADATHLFTVVSDGWTLCRKVADGEKLWEAELDVATEVDASPLIVNGKLCVLDVDGVMFVLDAGAEKTEPQTYQIPERCQATPAFAPGRMFIRGAKTLYCIGGKP